MTQGQRDDYPGTKEAQEAEHRHQEQMQEKLLAENARLAEMAHVRGKRNIWLTAILAAVAPILVALITLLGAKFSPNPYEGLAKAFGDGMRGIAQAISQKSWDPRPSAYPGRNLGNSNPITDQPSANTGTPALTGSVVQLPKLVSSSNPDCTGLDVKVWDVTLGPVGKATLSSGLGYTVLIHVKNKSDLTQLVSIRGDASLTDDRGNSAAVTSPTIPRKSSGFLTISSGTDSAVQFKSEQVPYVGHSIQVLSVPLQITSLDAQGRSRADGPYGLTCSNLPLNTTSATSEQ